MLDNSRRFHVVIENLIFLNKILIFFTKSLDLTKFYIYLVNQCGLPIWFTKNKQANCI